MRTIIISIITLMMCGTLNATVSFSGTTHKVITEKPEASTGLNSIYVLHNLNGAQMIYTATTSLPVTWYKYSNLGGGYAEEIANVKQNGKNYTLNITGSGDMGYIIEEGTNRYYCWVVDYSQHRAQLSSLGFAEQQDCDMTELYFSGKADRIIYYTINGQGKELDRGITLSYYTLQYNEASESYEQIITEKSYQYLSGTLRVTAPLCDTEFTLSGDKYLKQWNEIQSVTSENFITNAVEAKTSANQTPRENDNEQKVETALGGSAPCEIEFKAVCSDAVVFQEWQLSTDADFENITTRINDPVTTHIFRENGTIYVRFMASNTTGSCDYYSDTYEVFVGESYLECPNAFSPDASEGVNDEWKVSYKSIISFECHIFNRWGIKVAELNDPSQGWDGKHNGKFVPAGVYYYVIKAEGSDGKKYKLNGDINIIKYKGATGTTNTPTE